MRAYDKAGNDAADAMAKLGSLLHPSPEQHLQAVGDVLGIGCKMAAWLCRAISFHNEAVGER